MDYCLSSTDLSDKEHGFLRSLSRLLYQFGNRFEISERQLVWLIAIYERLRGEP